MQIYKKRKEFQIQLSHQPFHRLLKKVPSITSSINTIKPQQQLKNKLKKLKNL